MTKLAIVSTHPIQYNAPLFRLLAGSSFLSIKVFYTWSQSQKGQKYDPGFKKNIEWDIPLLDGYDYSFVKNTSSHPGTHHFKGIINPSLNSEIDSWKPDTLLVFGWSFSSHLKCIRYFHKKIPVIFRGDSTLLDEVPGIKTLFRRVFLKWVYRHVDYVLYTGTNNKAYFLKHGLKESQLIFAPHAVDNDRFSGNNDDYKLEAARIRQAFGIAGDDIVLLFAGKLEKKKNPFFLLEIARRIRHPRLKILYVGNGDLEDQLKESAAGDERVFFMDFCNQAGMPVIYRVGDIFILPSLGPAETWGLGANEAMASGLAVMLSEKVGGATDLVRDSSNGIIFNTGNIEKCIEFINGVLENRKRLADMKKNSENIIKEFSYNRVVLAMEHLLTSVTTSTLS